MKLIPEYLKSEKINIRTSTRENLEGQPNFMRIFPIIKTLSPKALEIAKTVFLRSLELYESSLKTAPKDLEKVIIAPSSLLEVFFLDFYLNS
jgi:hypothetical protein